MTAINTSAQRQKRPGRYRDEVFQLAVREQEVCPKDGAAGAAGGLSVKLVCKVGEGVLARLGRNDGQFEMVAVRCSSFEPPSEEIEARRKEWGIPFWPHGFVRLQCDIEELLRVWNNEYACPEYGEHLYEEVLAWCEQTGIKSIGL